MLKKFAIIAVMGLFLVSCGQVSEKNTETADLKLIAELVAEPLAFDGQEVTFEGTITHICRHSGDKFRVNQIGDADFSIMVMLEDFQTQFSPESEGKNIKISGIVKTSVRNMDALEENHEHDHAHDGEEGHDCASTEEAVKRLQERGITPDIVAYIEMTSFEILETPAAETEEAEAEETVETEEAEETEEVVKVAQAKKAACC